MFKQRTPILILLLVVILALVFTSSIVAQGGPLFVPAPGSPFATAGLLPSTLDTGDFNGDGHVDVVTANFGQYDGTSMMFGDGNGGLTLFGISIPGPGYAYGITAEDFNADGLLDIATVAGDVFNRTLYVRLGDGNGNLLPFYMQPVNPLNPRAIVSGDFNTDGFIDAAISDVHVPGDINVFLNQGDGNLAAAPASPFDAGSLYVWSFAADDINDDGQHDFITSNYSPLISVLLGDGTGDFALVPGMPVNAGVNTSFAVALADFNNDGFQDVAVADNNMAGDSVGVLLGDGTGNLALMPGSPFVTGGGPHFFVAASDFDLDGRQDIVVTNVLDDSVSVLLNTGAGFTPAPGSPFATGSTEPRMVVVEDFNEDGLPDLAVVNFTGNTVSILLNQTIPPTPTPVPSPTTDQTPAFTPTPPINVTPVPSAAVTPIPPLPERLPDTGETPWFIDRLRTMGVVLICGVILGALVAWLTYVQSKRLSEHSN